MALGGTPWTQWENLAEIVPEAEWGALLGDRTRFLIIPISLAGLDPHPEALDHAMLARLGIAYPSQQLAEFKSIEVGPAVGHAFRLTRDVSGVTNVYSLWVLRRGDFAYLAAAWMDQSPEKGGTINANPAELHGALSAISFDDVLPAAIEASTLNAIERQTHGTIFNDLGLFAFNSRDDSAAIQCFQNAFERSPNDAAILQNLLNAHIELKQYSAALAPLEPCLERFSNQPDLCVCRAARCFWCSVVGVTGVDYEYRQVTSHL